MKIHSKLSKSSLGDRYPDAAMDDVKHCVSDIQGLVRQKRLAGYDDDYIETHMGSYLDEIYEAYQKSTEEEFGMIPEDFEKLYTLYTQEAEKGI